MRKILCRVLAFGILCCYFTNSFAENMQEEQNIVQEENTNTSLKTQQEELENQIEQSEQELEIVKEELSENLQQVQKLDEKISNSEKEIGELTTKVTELKVSIEETEAKLKIAEDNYIKQKEILEARLIAMYEAGDTQYLDVILQSRNISEFLSNYFLITEIAIYDTELLEEVKEKKDEIELTKKKLEKNKEDLTVSLQSQTKMSKIMQNTKALRENYISKLSDKEKDVQQQIDEYKTRFAEVNAEILALAMQGIDTEYIGGVLAWPVPGYTRISSKYGMRTHPITGIYKLHTGVDISAPMGANFVAANDGIVTKAGYNSAYGNMVIIDHGGGVSTLYAHGSEILVEVGQTVKRNEAVLKVGSTGYSTGPHAHFEVRINGVVTNPIEYITNGVIPSLKNEENKKEEKNKENNTTQNQSVETN